MHVIAVASQKGGSGKTTVAGHIAVAAERANAGPVALIDTDPQGSLAEWWNEREASTPIFVHTAVPRLAQDLERLREMDTELVIIDTPPAITSTISEVIKISDLVLIPTRPSPHDLRSVGATVELAEDLNKPLIFVINGAHPRARITSEAVIALSQHGTLAPAIIHQRTNFASSMIDGRTVMEVAGGTRSGNEIVQLWTYMDNRLNKSVRPTILMPRSGLMVMPPRKEAATEVGGQEAS